MKIVNLIDVIAVTSDDFDVPAKVGGYIWCYWWTYMLVVAASRKRWWLPLCIHKFCGKLRQLWLTSWKLVIFFWPDQLVMKVLEDVDYWSWSWTALVWRVVLCCCGDILSLHCGRGISCFGASCLYEDLPTCTKCWSHHLFTCSRNSLSTT